MKAIILSVMLCAGSRALFTPGCIDAPSIVENNLLKLEVHNGGGSECAAPEVEENGRCVSHSSGDSTKGTKDENEGSTTEAMKKDLPPTKEYKARDDCKWTNDPSAPGGRTWSC